MERLAHVFDGEGVGAENSILASHGKGGLRETTLGLPKFHRVGFCGALHGSQGSFVSKELDACHDRRITREVVGREETRRGGDRQVAAPEKRRATRARDRKTCAWRGLPAQDHDRGPRGKGKTGPICNADEEERDEGRGHATQPEMSPNGKWRAVEG